MSDRPPERIYTEEEIGRILQRAADLQGKESRRPLLGLSLAELQQLARESDIDPSFIEAAALELAGAATEDDAGFFGGPLTVTVRRRIEGTVSEDAFNRMVSEARKRFKKSGKTSAVGSTREWSTENDRDQSASFSLRERDGHTELELFWSESDLLPIPFVTIPIVITLLAVPVVGEELALPALWAVLVVLAWAAVVASSSRALFRSVTARHRRQVRGFGDVLVEIADQERRREPAAESGARSARTGTEDRERRVALDGPDDSGSDGPGRERTRTR